MRDQVNESPTPTDINTLMPTLREYGHAINTLIGGLETMLTANLPAASPDLEGLLVVEQSGGARNLVLYTKNTRTRFTGVNF